MDGESAESDVVAVDVEPQPRAAKRGRLSQDDDASPPTVRNGGGGGDAPGVAPEGRWSCGRFAPLIGWWVDLRECS